MNQMDCLIRRAAACAAFFLVWGASPKAGRAQSPKTTGGNGDFARTVREGNRRPRLVVVVSIDQFRADFLRRFADVFLPPETGGGNVGGFRYLMTRGSDFVDAHYAHFPLYTGPGHAVILSGGYPYKTGIIANDWWDKKTKREVYCVDDPRQTVVGALPASRATPMGPLNMRSTTVGDELKLATAGRAKVVSLSLKDRAAILLGGHTQDVSLWFDTEGGRWISSSAYCKNGKLPDWVEAENAERLPDKTLGTTWNPSLSTEQLAAHSFAPVLAPNTNPSGLGARFPHRVPSEKTAANYGAFTLTPDANAFVLETAARAVSSETMGQRDGVTDLLAINLATNDYAGHAWGPYSPELADITVQTDRQISTFLNFLRKNIPGGLQNVVFVVTADHGVSPVPEDLTVRNITSGRLQGKAVSDAIDAALTARYGKETWFSQSDDGKESGAFVEGYVSLNDAVLSRLTASGKAASRAEIETVAADAARAVPGVYNAYTRTQILNGNLPPNEMARHIANAYFPGLSGDLLIINDQLFVTGGRSGTSHGTLYSYDTHVPLLLCGWGIAPGVWTNPVSPADIAPTLCNLLGIESPSACDGVILSPALK